MVKNYILQWKLRGYDKYDDISTKEKLQINSAEAFFKKLLEKGVNIRYEKKLNGDELSQMITEILK